VAIELDAQLLRNSFGGDHQAKGETAGNDLGLLQPLMGTASTASISTLISDEIKPATWTSELDGRFSPYSWKSTSRSWATPAGDPGRRAFLPIPRARAGSGRRIATADRRRRASGPSISGSARLAFAGLANLHAPALTEAWRRARVR